MIRIFLSSLTAVLFLAAPSYAQSTAAKVTSSLYTNSDGFRVTSFNSAGLYSSWVDLGRDGYQCSVKGRATGAITVKAVTNSTGTGTYATLAANPAVTITSTGPSASSFVAQRYVFVAWSASGTSSDYIQLDCSGNVGRTFTLCDEELTDNAVCDDGSSNDRYAITTGFNTLLFDSSESSSANYTCNIFGATKAVADLADKTDLSAKGFQMNTVGLSNASEAIIFSDTPVDVVWITCGTIADGNSVTVSVTARP